MMQEKENLPGTSFHQNIIGVVMMIGVCTFVPCACSGPPTPPMYFRLDMQVQVNQETLAISFNWHCKQQLQGGEGLDFKARGWGWALDGDRELFIKKKLDDKTLLLIRAPDVASCNPNFVEARPYENYRIEIVKTVPATIGWEVFDSEHDQSPDYIVQMRSAVIHRLMDAAHDTRYSDVEHQQMKSIMTLPLIYQSVIEEMPSTMTKLQNPIPLIRQGEVWKLTPDGRNGHQATLHFTIPHKLAGMVKEPGLPNACPPVTVEFQRTLFSFKSSQQLYDEESKLPVSLVTRCESLPWSDWLSGDLPKP
jgi:hypothetical protein